MSIWLILFLVQVIASVYAFARQPKQDRRWGAYVVREACLTTRSTHCTQGLGARGICS